MTYCVAMRLHAGLVFLSDSRTNAGIDNVGTFRKMYAFENPGDRVMVLMTSGNLSLSQSIRQMVTEYATPDGKTIWTVNNMYEAAQIVGQAIRLVHARDAKALEDFGIDFNVRMVFGGQIGNESCRLFQVYSAGNFIESHDENPYFQIGESKYGKPIIDRVITPSSSLDEAAKCALISMDSTLRSNVSVGLPLDLLVYEAGSLAITRFVNITEKNRYFQMIRDIWGTQLKQIFESIEDPVWNAPDQGQPVALSVAGNRSHPVRIQPPAELRKPDKGEASLQSVAQENGDRQH
jgi:putative proteasome-type protease